MDPVHFNIRCDINNTTDDLRSGCDSGLSYQVGGGRQRLSKQTLTEQIVQTCYSVQLKDTLRFLLALHIHVALI